jgi:hypothetical protein
MHDQDIPIVYIVILQLNFRLGTKQSNNKNCFLRLQIPVVCIVLKKHFSIISSVPDVLLQHY